MKIVMLLLAFIAYCFIFYRIIIHYSFMRIGKLRVKRNKVIAYYIKGKIISIVLDGKVLDLTYVDSESAEDEIKRLDKRFV